MLFFYYSINSGLVSEIVSVGSSSEFASFNFDFVSSLKLIIFEIHSKTKRQGIFVRSNSPRR